MSTENKKLSIVEFTADNVTNLKAVRIRPDRSVVVLSGANEAGKSNILDTIQAMLDGLRIKMPIRQGEERADATIDLGDIKIRKRWTAKGEGLEVYEMVDGKKRVFTSPRDFLDKLTGKMVDPMKLYSLMKNDPKKFRQSLADLVGLDLTDLKNEEEKVRSDRKLINDKIRDAVAQLKEMDAPDPDTPDEEVTFKESLDNVNRLREKREVFKRAHINKRDLETELEQNGEDVAELQAQIIRLEKEIEGFHKRSEEIRNSKEYSGDLPEEVTEEQITGAESEIQSLENKNVRIRSAKRYRQKVKESKKFQKESDEFSQKLERIEQDKRTRIASCKFPVEGLSLTEAQVIYDGKPIDVASSGRQIRIFTKMAIAMSPQIKVMIVRDGSFLDNKGFQEICDIAEEEGYQVWMEKVDESGKVGIFIEDGEITAIDGNKIQPEQPAEADNIDQLEKPTKKGEKLHEENEKEAPEMEETAETARNESQGQVVGTEDPVNPGNSSSPEATEETEPEPRAQAEEVVERDID